MTGLEKWRLSRTAAIPMLLLLNSCVGPMAAEGDPMAAASDLAAACARSVCRTEVKRLTLNAENGRFEYMTDLFPYADSGTVSIFPGETIVVEFESDTAVSTPRFVKVTDHGHDAGTQEGMAVASPGAKPTISFEFRQDPDKPSMTLEVSSTLGTLVKYDALMWVPTPNGIRPARTSSCPLFAARGFETWPHPIVMLVLTNFRVLPREGGTIVCQ